MQICCCPWLVASVDNRFLLPESFLRRGTKVREIEGSKNEAGVLINLLLRQVDVCRARG